MKNLFITMAYKLSQGKLQHQHQDEKSKRKQRSKASVCRWEDQTYILSTLSSVTAYLNLTHSRSFNVKSDLAHHGIKGSNLKNSRGHFFSKFHRGLFKPTIQLTDSQ